MICTLRVKNRYVIRRKSKKTCICMKNLARFAEHPTSKDNIKRLIWQAPRHLKFHILLRQMTLVLIYGVFQFNEANVKALEIHSGLFKSLMLTILSSFLMEWFHNGLLVFPWTPYLQTDGTNFSISVKEPTHHSMKYENIMEQFH